jgi:hypothetical protein
VDKTKNTIPVMNDRNEDNELRNLCVQRLNRRIIGHFINTPNLDYDEGLYTGGSGIALLFASYYLWSKNRNVLNKLYNQIEAISKQIYSQDYPSATFSSGIAEFGWLIIYLSILDYDHINWDEILMLH